MVITMISEIDVVNLCEALYYTEIYEGTTHNKREAINEHWKGTTSDHRYKIYSGNVRENGSGIWYIGDPNRHGFCVIVERFTYDNVYFARFASETNIFQKLPCYKVEFVDNSCIINEWQNEVLI